MLYNNGQRIGIGSTTPSALLHTYGVATGDGNILFQGTYKASNPGAPPTTGAGTRLIWYPDKAAFRAGHIDGTQWDKDSIGDFSFAAGFDTKAKGKYAAAIGRSNKSLGLQTFTWGHGNFASGENATTFGMSNSASGYAATSWGTYNFSGGNYATSWGYISLASGLRSTAWGESGIASGENATSWGENTSASGLNSTAWGRNSQATAEQATAWGYDCQANGANSTALGRVAVASGQVSTAIGYGLEAASYGETVLGLYNQAYTPAYPDAYYENDRLFVIGNGTQHIARSNALVILKNGNTGLGTSYPAALLHTYGNGTGKGNVLFEGVFQSFFPGPPPASGAGTRMMWYPDKAAFRAGQVNGSQWNESNIGNNSVAFGAGCTASGGMAAAMGYNCVASGSSSFAAGEEAIASGYRSVAMGGLTTASGSYATALGNNSIASGSNTTALGYYTTASSYVSLVCGRFNVISGSYGTSWFSSDPLFVVGNGSSSSSRNNALTVLKNGYVGIGPSSPSAGLHLKGSGFPGSFMYLESNSGQDAGFRLYEGSTDKWHIFNNSSLAGLQVYNTSGTTAIFAKQSNANVGIGTTNPAYKLQVGNAGDGTTARANAWNLLSDARFKRDFVLLENPLSIIENLNGYYFYWNIGIDTNRQIGFSAQEVQKVLPELVSTGEDGYLSMEYSKLSPVLVEAIKSLHMEIQALKSENEALKQALSLSQNGQQQIEQRMQKLEAAIFSK